MFGVFQYDIYLPFLLEDFVEFYDVWMPQSPVDKYLSPEVFFINS
jgi:hypothetical protein